MGYSTPTVPGTSINLIVEDSNASVNPEEDVTDGVAGRVLAVKIDNRLNAGSDVYLKLYDQASGVEAGVTDPDVILRSRRGKVTEYLLSFSYTNLTYSVSTSPGTAGQVGAGDPVRLCIGLQV